MAYKFYMGKMLLPVAPPKMQLKINNQNKTITLINDGEVNILKHAKLSDIEFEVLIPQVTYPFATYENGFKGASYYLCELEIIKINKEPFSFKVVRTFPNGNLLFDTEMIVSLEDYKIMEDAKNGFDFNVSISLKQYKDYGTKMVKIVDDRAIITKTRPHASSPAPKKSTITHKIVKGDNLWKLARYYYGDGSKYMKIYNANKDKLKSPDYIYIGQVLIIPV